MQPVFKMEAWDPDTDLEENSLSVITFGFNYFLNDWTRLQLNYLYKAEDQEEISNDELLMQLQVKF